MDNLIHGAPVFKKCTLVPRFFKKWANEHIPSFDLPAGGGPATREITIKTRLCSLGRTLRREVGAVKAGQSPGWALSPHITAPRPLEAAKDQGAGVPSCGQQGSLLATCSFHFSQGPKVPFFFPLMKIQKKSVFSNTHANNVRNSLQCGMLENT